MSDLIDDTPDLDRDRRLDDVSRDPAARHAAIEAAIAAYALGALDPADATTVAAHVPACDRCADLLVKTERVIHALPLLLPTMTPPATAKTALMARIAQSAPVVVETVPASRVLGRRHAARLPIGRSAPPVPGGPPRQGTGRPWWSGFVAPMASAVPLVIALVVVGGWAMDLRAQVDRLEMVPNLISHGDGSIYEMNPGPSAPDSAVARVFSDDSRAMLVVSNLSTAGGGGTYRVLVQTDEAMVPVGEFTVDDGGDGQTMLDLPQRFAEYKSVHIRAVPRNPEATATVDAFSKTIRNALENWAQDPGTGASTNPGEDE